LTATDTALGYDIQYIKDYRTYTFWRAANAGTKYITVDCGSNKSADTLAVISHNLQVANATVSVESSLNNVTWTERLAGFTPQSNKAFLKTFTSASARYWRLKIVTSSIAPQLAVVMLGNRLTFPFPPDTPFVVYSEGVEAETARSKAGHILGSVINYKTIEISVRFSNLTRSWVLNTFKPFWDNHASDLKPFFWAWDIDVYPDLIFYVSVTDGMKYKMPVSVIQFVDSIELEMQGIKEV
jgi:hypothetical protein